MRHASIEEQAVIDLREHLDGRDVIDLRETPEEWAAGARRRWRRPVALVAAVVVCGLAAVAVLSDATRGGDERTRPTSADEARGGASSAEGAGPSIDPGPALPAPPVDPPQPASAPGAETAPEPEPVDPSPAVVASSPTPEVPAPARPQAAPAPVGSPALVLERSDADVEVFVAEDPADSSVTMVVGPSPGVDDLRIELLADPPAAGEGAPVQVRVRNQGDDAVGFPDGFEVTVVGTSDGERVAEVVLREPEVAALQPGEELLVSGEIALPLGTTVLHAELPVLAA